MQTHITLQRQGGHAELRLEAPEGKPPTLDVPFLQELSALLEHLHEQPPRSLLIRSSSPKYFCVGANLNVLKDCTEETIVPWVKCGHDVLNQLEDLPCPSFAIVSGYAMGGGLELAMACDLILASPNARFAQSEAALGFIPGWGGTRRLPERVGRAKAKRMFFTGELLDAGTALEWGLVDLCEEEEALEERILAWQEAIVRQSAHALSTFKRILNEAQRLERNVNRETEARLSKGCLQDPDTKERLQAFLEKRKR